jgi:hypothetical protein
MSSWKPVTIGTLREVCIMRTSVGLRTGTAFPPRARMSMLALHRIRPVEKMKKGISKYRHTFFGSFR